MNVFRELIKNSKLSAEEREKRKCYFPEDLGEALDAADMLHFTYHILYIARCWTDTRYSSLAQAELPDRLVGNLEAFEACLVASNMDAAIRKRGANIRDCIQVGSGRDRFNALKDLEMLQKQTSPEAVPFSTACCDLLECYREFVRTAAPGNSTKACVRLLLDALNKASIANTHLAAWSFDGKIEALKNAYCKTPPSSASSIQRDTWFIEFLRDCASEVEKAGIQGITRPAADGGFGRLALWFNLAHSWDPKNGKQIDKKQFLKLADLTLRYHIDPMFIQWKDEDDPEWGKYINDYDKAKQGSGRNPASGRKYPTTFTSADISQFNRTLNQVCNPDHPLSKLAFVMLASKCATFCLSVGPDAALAGDEQSGVKNDRQATDTFMRRFARISELARLTLEIPENLHITFGRAGIRGDSEDLMFGQEMRDSLDPLSGGSSELASTRTQLLNAIRDGHDLKLGSVNAARVLIWLISRFARVNNSFDENVMKPMVLANRRLIGEST